MKRFGDLLGSQSQSRSLLEEAPTADVRDLIGSGDAKVAGSTSGDDMKVKKKKEDTAGLLDQRTLQEPRSAYFP